MNNDTPKPISELKPAEYNPREMDAPEAEALANSMDYFGDLSAIVNNRQTGNLVGGHQRINQLLKRPETHIIFNTQHEPDSLGTVGTGFVIVDGTDIKLPFREVDWPLEKEMAANVAANQIQGRMVMPLLAKINEQLAAHSEALLALTGQRQEQISQLADRFGKKQESSETADVPVVDNENPPRSRRGVVYQLGQHRLMCGDSASESDVDFLMEGQQATMAFTDPPYNVGYAGGGGQKREGIKNDKMGSDVFLELLGKWCANLVRCTEGAIYICMSPKELGALKAAFEAGGGHWHDYIIWVKDRFTLGGGDFQHQYEPILYGWPERITHKYIVPDRDMSDVWEDLSEVKADFDGVHTRIRLQGFEIQIEGKVEGKVRRKKMQSDIWRFNKPTASPEHPTMKPTMLCAEAIKNSSIHQGIVLDLFGGSGSTLIAAEETGRICRMMELDEKYVDVIRKRYAKLMGHETDWETYCPAAKVLESEAQAVVEAPAPV
jgi:DNA modification methylase